MQLGGFLAGDHLILHLPVANGADRVLRQSGGDAAGKARACGPLQQLHIYERGGVPLHLGVRGGSARHRLVHVARLLRGGEDRRELAAPSPAAAGCRIPNVFHNRGGS